MGCLAATVDKEVTLNSQEKLISSYETNRWLVQRFADGLSHEQSLAVPAFKTNNFNWVTGHIVVNRDRVLDLLGWPKLLSGEEALLYATDSSPATAETAVSLERLLSLLDMSQEGISEGLRAVGQAGLAARPDNEGEQTVHEHIEGLHWHETYHLGQLEILRQVSARRDAFP